MTAALSPCPFCGSDDVMIAYVGQETRSSTGRYGSCQNCGAQSTTRTSEAEAIAAWNRRAPSPERIGSEADDAASYEYHREGRGEGREEERAAIVAWLRRVWPRAWGCTAIAHGIERGEHLPAKSAVKEPGT